MSEQSITAKVLSVIQNIQVRKVINSLQTQVRDKASIKTRGIREIEKLEITKPSVVTQKNFAIRRVVADQTILKVSNVGPQGGRGEVGPMGPAGDIDNFEMEDLTTIFRGKLT